MKKQTSFAFNRKIYLLGEDSQGKRYWLEEAHWDCNWYWGFGYVESYTNNKHPEKARDIDSHSHFMQLFLSPVRSCLENFKNFFKKTPLTDSEIYKLCDYMQMFYSLSDVAAIFTHGDGHISSHIEREQLVNETQAHYINSTYLPKVFDGIYKLLSPED